ncbi:MAG TPA: ribonuclease PH [Pyrinomonadaceae bacterium]|nr:ribonuclease PH [Pyrinomonadaceae bacterium]HET9788466.1 ribonuclease PH [Pyrinomonadaceae bacterium]
MSFVRTDGRAADELRLVKITPGFLPYAEGSVLIEMGLTRVICSASIEDRVPPFLRNTGQGWVTAEYAMLPRSTQQRVQRETGRGGPSGRTHEIQRLIGRSLRAVTDMKILGERTITLDCDVLQADGGTRTAAITGAYVALALASRRLSKAGRIPKSLVANQVAAISVGIVDNLALLDLKYDEDSRAEVDMNVICTGDGRFIEVQGTAERQPYSREQMDRLLDLATKGIAHLVGIQRETLARANHG